MEIALIILFVTLGAVIGSFINALVFRYNTGKGITSRSMCFSCGEDLKARDLVPILSFLSLKGRCRYCRSKISSQYILVELTTALVFVLVYLKARIFIEDTNQFAMYSALHMFFWSAFIFISVYDLKHKIVPNEAVYSMILVAMLYAIFYSGSFIQIGYALIIFLPFLCLWLFSGGRLIGLGDGKIALALGMLLPISIASSGIILSFWIGAAYSVILLLLQKIRLNSPDKALTMKSELPFVPFMFIGSLIAFVLEMDVLSLNLWF